MAVKKKLISIKLDSTVYAAATKWGDSQETPLNTQQSVDVLMRKILKAEGLAKELVK
jgi:hypothetical protein